MIHQRDYVELGLACTEVCITLHERFNGVIWEINDDIITHGAIAQLRR